MADPRISPVEDNLLSFLEAVAEHPRYSRVPQDDVVAYFSEVAFPLFNAISGARFGPEETVPRTRQLLASYVDRGLPFLWWLTPSTTSPELEAELEAAGMEREAVPGMHVALDAPLRPVLPDGAEITVVDSPPDLRLFLDTMLEAFGMPPELAEEFAALLVGFDDRLVSAVATLDGRPVATGSAWLDGPTVGLYNIATLTAVRGRGLGHGLTAFLMDLGRERGCTRAVLHSSELGRPVYERLGFVEVCPVPQYVWVPST